jgi:hypothetical protein
MKENWQISKLVNGKELLEKSFAPKSRPSLQWLRQHTGKDIPAVKIGRLWFYDLKKVKAAMDNN